jgi:putative acetyltransferase
MQLTSTALPAQDTLLSRPAGRPSTRPTITIRRTRAADAEAFARVMSDEAVFGGVLQLPYPSVDVWRARLAENDAPGKTDLSLIAEVDAQMVGSAGLFSLGPALRRRHAIGLGISVAVDWQGQGVGKALMAALLDYADRWAGVLRIELTVFADNERAIALYRHFGFEVEGRMRGYALRDGQYADVLAMARLHPNPPQLPAAGA